MEKRKGKRVFAVILALIIAFGIIIHTGVQEEASAATEKAITDIPWDEVEAVIKKKVGEGYNEVGLCTGFVYWCLKNAYGVDWGDNSVVSDLEAKLKNNDITLVASGTKGSVTSEMKPGDIVIFLENGGGTHCAILGEGGKLYHATSSRGVVYSPTLSEWMSYPPEDKNCDQYRIYRGIQSTGEAKLIKSSATTDITDDNDCYSIKDAKYGVYSNKGCTSKVGTFTVKADGTSNVLELNVGTYYVKETKAPKGYILDDTVYTVKVEAGKTTKMEVEDKPKATTTLINLYKMDLETGRSEPQGSGSLAGTQFIWKYYGGYYTKDNLPAKPTRTWITQTKTETNGEEVSYVSRLEDGFKISGDNLYTQGGKTCIPLGTLTVEEHKPPEGYNLDSDTYIKEKGTEKGTKGPYITQIKEDGDIAELQGGKHFLVFDEAIRGGVKIQKRDLETRKAEAQGGASLENAEFTITNLSKGEVLVDGTFYAPGEVVSTIKSDVEGIAKTSENFLPYGTYEVEEVKPPEGYLLDGTKKQIFEVHEDGKIIDLTTEGTSAYNQVKRGDLEGVKIGAGTHKRLADVPFRIKNLSTGESHIILTDENGQFSTASDWASHKNNTNAGETNEDGIWFGEQEPDDSKGALLYGKYEIEELSCDSNEGMKLIPPFEIKVYRNNSTIHLGTLTDEYEEEITVKTFAVNKDTEDKYISTAEDVTIVDTITMTGLKKDVEYMVKGWQMVREDNVELSVDGVPVTNELVFTAEKSDMEIQMEFTFDASGLTGKSLVTFEELYEISEDGEAIKVAEHTDINDEGQTVTVVNTPESRKIEELPEPTEPTEPMTPIEPMQSATPNEPDQPTEPKKTIQPAQPEKSADDEPETGDSFTVLQILIIMTTASLAGVVAIAGRRRREK